MGMQADKYGTYAAGKRATNGRVRCKRMTFAVAATAPERKAIWCSLDSYAVASGGQCREWQQRQEA
jgi:hypothetical protein